MDARLKGNVLNQKMGDMVNAYIPSASVFLGLTRRREGWACVTVLLFRGLSEWVKKKICHKDTKNKEIDVTGACRIDAQDAQEAATGQRLGSWCSG